MKTRHRQADSEALGDHIDRLYRAARCMCTSPRAAEDLVQEAFVRVGKKPWRLGAEHNLPYLLSVLRNTSIAIAADTRPQALPQPGSVDPLDPAHVYRAIAALPDDLRDAVTAVDIVGLSPREGAKALCVGETTIATRLHHGRQRIALSLSEPDLASNSRKAL